MMLNTSTFAKNFDFIWAFSYCYLTSYKGNKTLNTLGHLYDVIVPKGSRKIY